MSLDNRRLAKIRLLTEVSRRLTNAASMDEVLALTVDRAATLLDAKRSVLALMDDDGVFQIRTSFGLDTHTLPSFRESLEGHLVERLQLLLGLPQFLAVPLVIG